MNFDHQFDFCLDADVLVTNTCIMQVIRRASADKNSISDIAILP